MYLLFFLSFLSLNVADTSVPLIQVNEKLKEILSGLEKFQTESDVHLDSYFVILAKFEQSVRPLIGTLVGVMNSAQSKVAEIGLDDSKLSKLEERMGLVSRTATSTVYGLEAVQIKLRQGLTILLDDSKPTTLWYSSVDLFFWILVVQTLFVMIYVFWKTQKQSRRSFGFSRR
eukprot:TRINITY_DN1633_c0_g2_i1.p1 TRINITY_DN1633_c0_g2~~TRINITY_DN1633_c0_g2_i1.p1  ORF type:complete len:202 (-),score=49.75 TRINITY_DN1633_c0_g2_i1:241-759(-)